MTFFLMRILWNYNSAIFNHGVLFSRPHFITRVDIIHQIERFNVSGHITDSLLSNSSEFPNT